MSGWACRFWLALLAAGIVASGLFSGLETGVYSLNRVRLHLRSHEGDRRARAMEKMLAKPAPLLVALLIGTNIATNLATSAMGIIKSDLPVSRSRPCMESPSKGISHHMVGYRLSGLRL